MVGIGFILALPLPAHALRMTDADFKEAVNKITNGIANGASLNLRDISAASGQALTKIWSDIPGAFATWLEDVEFTKNVVVKVDYDHQAVVVEGDYALPKIVPQFFVHGIIRFSSNLTSYNTGSNVALQSSIKLTQKQAQENFNNGLSALGNGLQSAMVLDLPERYRISEILQAYAKSASGSNKSRLQEAIKIFKVIDDIIDLKTTSAIGICGVTYKDPVIGTLNSGFNYVGTLNLFADWLNPLLDKVFKAVGASASFKKGLRVHFTIAKSILGSEFDIEIPGQLRWGLPNHGKTLIQTERLKVEGVLAPAGITIGKLEAQLKTGLQLFLPWQDKPLSFDVVFTLDTKTNVKAIINMRELQMGPLPITLQDVFVEAGLNIIVLIKFIAYIIESVIDQAGAVESYSVTEGAEVVETADEAKDVPELVIPINAVGLGGSLNIMERVIDLAACFEYNPDGGNINVILNGSLTNSLGKDVLSISDIYQLFYGLQKEALTLSKKLAKTADEQKMVNLLQEILELNKSFDQKISPILKGFAIKSAFIHIAPKSGRCNLKTYNSGIEIEAAGSFMGAQFEADIVLNIFSLLTGSIYKSSSKGSDFKSIASNTIKNSFSNITNFSLTTPSFGPKTQQPKPTGIFKGISKVGNTIQTVEQVGVGTVGALLIPSIFGIYIHGGLTAPWHVGPITLSGLDSSKGPEFMFSIGSSNPQAPTDTAQKVPYLFGTFIDGKLAIDIEPGFSGGFGASLGLTGLDIAAGGNIGKNSAYVSGSLAMLNPLKSNVILEITGGLTDIAKTLNTSYGNFINNAQNSMQKLGSSAQKDLTTAQNAVSTLKNKLTSTQSQLDAFNKAMQQCVKDNPLGKPLQLITQQINTLLMQINPDQIIDQIGNFANLGLDVDAIKKQMGSHLNETTNGFSLNVIPGLSLQLVTH